MARRIIEEDVTTTPTVDRTTYVDNEASWAGQTVALIALVVLLVVGAIWLVNSMGDDDGTTNNNVPNEAPVNPGNDTDTETNTDTDTPTDVVPQG